MERGKRRNYFYRNNSESFILIQILMSGLLLLLHVFSQWSFSPDSEFCGLQFQAQLHLGLSDINSILLTQKDDDIYMKFFNKWKFLFFRMPVIMQKTEGHPAILFHFQNNNTNNFRNGFNCHGRMVPNSFLIRAL